MSPQNLLTDRAVTLAIQNALLSQGIRKPDLPDAVQDVYVKALQSFQTTPPPTEVERMAALCAEIARNYAIDLFRSAGRKHRDLVGRCDPDEFTPLEYGAAQRDPIDARRQLEVLVELFEEGCMPEHGVDILDGVATHTSYEELAVELGIPADLARWRMREMKRIFRARLAKRGMLPGMLPLRLIVSEPAAMERLRRVA